MKINKFERQDNLISLEIEVDPETVSQKRQQVIEEAKKEVKLPGFRPGKAPSEILEKRLGKEYFLEKTLEKVLNDSYFQVVKEKKLEPIDYPKDLKVIQNEENKPLIYSLKVEVKPEINITKDLLKKIKVKIKLLKVSDDDVNRVLEEVREKLATFEEVKDRPVQNGDLLKIEIKATLNDEPVNEWTMENAGIKIGDAIILKQFDDELIGLKLDESKNFSIEFPSQYPLQKVAGKNVNFYVKIKEIRGLKKPEINDELAKKAGPFQNLEEFKKQIKADLTAKAEENNRYNTGQEIIKKIAEEVKLKIPDVLIKRRVEFIKNNFETELANSGINLNDYLKYLNKSETEYLNDLRIQAETEVKTELILSEVNRTQNFTITQEEIALEINNLAKSTNQDPIQLNEMIDTQTLENIKNYIILRKSINFLIENSEVEYVE